MCISKNEKKHRSKKALRIEKKAPKAANTTAVSVANHCEQRDMNVSLTSLRKFGSSPCKAFTFGLSLNHCSVIVLLMPFGQVMPPVRLVPSTLPGMFNFKNTTRGGAGNLFAGNQPTLILHRVCSLLVAPFLPL